MKIQIAVIKHKRLLIKRIYKFVNGKKKKKNILKI